MNMKAILDNIPPEAKGIKIINNSISTLPSNAFVNHAKLNTLCLSNNQIEIVEKDAFKGLKNLQYLDLKHNQIENISEVWKGLELSLIHI